MRRETYLVVALAALAVLGGCVGGGGSPDTTDGQQATTDDGRLSGSEIRQRALAASENIETAEYRMNMEVSANGNEITMTANGALDLKNRKQRLNMTMDLPSRDVEATTYIDGNTGYVETMGMWRTRDVSDRNIWKRDGQLGNSAAMLEAVTVTREGTATVAGTETYVLKMEANDMSKFKSALQKQMSQNPSSQSFDGEIKSFDAKAYVAKDTNFIRKMEMNMEMKINGQEADLTMTIVYTEVNGDVSITIPEEAKGMVQPSATGSAA